MRITYDPAKREATLAARGLDFEHAARVFAGRYFSVEDTRQAYGERRYVTIGEFDGRMVVLVWTPRGRARHMISMRKANDRERKRYQEQLDRS